MKQAFSPFALKVTALEALAAALAASAALALEMPIWAMFLGWNAYFTRGTGMKSGAVNLGCVLIGLCLGMTAQWLLAALSSRPGFAEQVASVFVVTWVVLSLRFLPKFDNVAAFFLGLVAFFASGLEPTWPTFAVLAGAAGLGTAAGWLTSAAQARWLGVSKEIVESVAPHGQPRREAAA